VLLGLAFAVCLFAEAAYRAAATGLEKQSKSRSQKKHPQKKGLKPCQTVSSLVSL
jgi:hypothetical protein